MQKADSQWSKIYEMSRNMNATVQILHFNPSTEVTSNTNCEESGARCVVRHTFNIHEVGPDQPKLVTDNIQVLILVVYSCFYPLKAAYINTTRFTEIYEIPGIICGFCTVIVNDTSLVSSFTRPLEDALRNILVRFWLQSATAATPLDGELVYKETLKLN